MGADVTVFSTSKSKRDDAIKFGAKQFILSTDFEQINVTSNKFDFIIDCVSAKHDLIHILSTLRFGGIFCMIGAPPTPLEVPPFSLIQKRLNVTGSFIGGMKETQEMLEFSGQHNITYGHYGDTNLASISSGLRYPITVNDRPIISEFILRRLKWTKLQTLNYTV
ncbi:unnamed protein product [Rotaria sp. Silwood2]|nr:unnamed protein product [Rotaria sp. Silwood2]